MRDTARQSTLPAARAANARGTFQARRRVDGMRVGLVDDVMTTGDTRYRRRAGATGVAVFCVARA